MRKILLDTNALIALSDSTDSLFQYIEMALRAGAQACTCSVAWHEYVRGPLLDKDQDRALRVIESRIFSLDRRHAEVAAELFNQTGRRRGSTADCLIAANAVCHKAELLTRNLADFRPFVALGLSLVAV
jgi:predicted nucleic acid-binding protein